MEWDTLDFGLAEESIGSGAIEREDDELVFRTFEESSIGSGAIEREDEELVFGALEEPSIGSGAIEWKEEEGDFGIVEESSIDRGAIEWKEINFVGRAGELLLDAELARIFSEQFCNDNFKFVAEAELLADNFGCVVSCVELITSDSLCNSLDKPVSRKASSNLTSTLLTLFTCTLLLLSIDSSENAAE